MYPLVSAATTASPTCLKDSCVWSLVTLAPPGMQHRRERALQLTSPPSSSSASSSLIAASALGQPAMSLSSHSYPAPGQLATSSKPGGARIAPSSSPPRRTPQQQPEQQQPHHNQPHHGPQDNPSWVALVSCVGTVWWWSPAATAHMMLSSQAVLRVHRWPLAAPAAAGVGVDCLSCHKHLEPSLAGLTAAGAVSCWAPNPLLVAFLLLFLHHEAGGL